MSDELSSSILYNTQTPKEILMLTSLIVDTYNLVKAKWTSTTWSIDSDCEIGFYRRDKITKSNIFLGIWFETWESFGIPLCITLDYTGKSITDKQNQINRFFENKELKGLVFKKDYQGFAVVLIEHSFYNFQNDGFRLTELFNELTKLLEIDIVR